MAQLSDRAHKELLMLYNNAVDDIDRTKREQGSHFYAVLLAQVGVAGFSRIRFPPPWGLQEREFIWITLAGLMLLGILLMFMHQLRLFRVRSLVERYSEKLEPNSGTFLMTKEAHPLHRFAIPFLMFMVMLLVFSFLSTIVS